MLFFRMLLRYHALVYDSPRTGALRRRCGSRTRSAGAGACEHRLNLHKLIQSAVTACDLLYLHHDYSADEMLGELKVGLKV